MGGDQDFQRLIGCIGDKTVPVLENVIERFPGEVMLPYAGNGFGGQSAPFVQNRLPVQQVYGYPSQACLIGVGLTSSATSQIWPFWASRSDMT